RLDGDEAEEPLRRGLAREWHRERHARARVVRVRARAQIEGLLFTVELYRRRLGDRRRGQQDQREREAESSHQESLHIEGMTAGALWYAGYPAERYSQSSDGTCHDPGTYSP